MSSCEVARLLASLIIHSDLEQRVDVGLAVFLLAVVTVFDVPQQS